MSNLQQETLGRDKKTPSGIGASAREVEHNAAAFLHIAHARIKLPNFVLDAGMVSVFFTAIGTASFLVGSLLILPETAALAD